MADKQRTKLVEQRATNAQTLAFVADQEATIVDQAEALAKERPEYTEFAARERENRERLRGNWVPGTCISGAGVASGMGIGPAMAMMEEAQAPHPETDEDGLV